MKKHFIMSLLALAGMVFSGTTILAQSTFIYEKGKSFKDVNACQIQAISGLTGHLRRSCTQKQFPTINLLFATTFSCLLMYEVHFSAETPVPATSSGLITPTGSCPGCSVG